MRSNRGLELLITLLACLALTSCGLLRAPRWISRYRRPAHYERVHVVRKGETLSTIAQRYGLSVGAIALRNSLRDPDRIEVGQRLHIPRQDALAWLHRKRPRTQRRARPARVAPPTRPLLWPVRGRLTNGFSEDPTDPHKGIDIAAPAGTHIRAADGGKVLFSGVGPEGYGQMVIIQHRNHLVTVYAQNQANLVRVGDRVVRGQHIAYVGNSGNATEAHLHFEVRFENDPRDPMMVLPR